MHFLVDKVRRDIALLGMFGAGDSLLVAVSGGPDSVGLLEILCELQTALELHLVIGHVNHGLRGEESERDCEFVINLAKLHNLEVSVANLDLSKFHKSQSGNLEALLREQRYQQLQRMKARYQCDWICAGHTADDQAETILQHWIQGAGIFGLGGMSPVRNDRVVRPLINIKRSELREYLVEIGRSWRDDSSNMDIRYNRNYIRHCIMPLLQKMNPNLVRTVSQNSFQIRAYANELEREAEDVISHFFFSERTGFLFRASFLQRIGSTLRARVLLRLWQHIRLPEGRLMSGHLDTLSRIIARGTRSELNLPGGVSFFLGHQWCQIIRACNITQMYSSIFVAPPSKLIIENLAGTISFDLVTFPDDELPMSQTVWYIPIELIGLDYRITFRNELRQSSIELASGHRSIRRAMIDYKIPWFLRDAIPILQSQHGPAWILGVGIANWARAISSDGSYLRIGWDSPISLI